MLRLWPASLCLIVLLGLALASKPAATTGSSHAGLLTPADIHAVTELALLRVTLQDLVASDLTGRTGGASCLLAARGEAVLGVDLTHADVVLDPVNAMATVTLPPPRVLSVSMDHAATSVVHLGRRGLWIAVPGAAGEAELLQRTFRQAQTRLAAQAGSDAHLYAARERARKVLSDLVTSKGWTLQLHWR